MISQPRSSASAVMIIDDTESVALCVKTFLTIEGYDGIDIFGCPRKALDEIRRRGCPSFIITDYEMPVMSGVVFLESVRKLYPKARGVIITGHSAVPPEVAARFTVIRKDATNFFDQLLARLREEMGAKI
jgi:DNA-binding NtrC family response regulator